MHTIVIQYLNEQTGSVLNEFCRKKSFKVQLLHPIFHLHRYYYDYIIVNYIMIYLDNKTLERERLDSTTLVLSLPGGLGF